MILQAFLGAQLSHQKERVAREASPSGARRRIERQCSAKPLMEIVEPLMKLARSYRCHISNTQEVCARAHGLKAVSLPERERDCFFKDIWSRQLDELTHLFSVRSALTC
jgi:hypothetical protein